MVLIVIKHDQSGNAIGFSSSGHADYAEKGADIICAGISALTITTVLALRQLTKIKLKTRQNGAQGFLECRWENIPSEIEHTNLIVRVMVIGLQDLAAQYPTYLRVNEVEV
jgi:Predicted ribosomal protein